MGISLKCLLNCTPDPREGEGEGGLRGVRQDGGQEDAQVPPQDPLEGEGRDRGGGQHAGTEINRKYFSLYLRQTAT